MTITNSLARSSCTKCVEVLQELVSGLQQDNAGENNNNYNTNKSNSNSNSNTKNEPPPLTLLKAIARSSHQQRNEYDQWGQQQQRRRRNNDNNRHDHHQHHRRHQQQHNNKPKKSEKLKIEEIENGIRLIIPVETTSPTLMKRWTQLVQVVEDEEKVNVKDNDYDNNDNNILVDGTTLATSIRIQNNNNNVVNYDGDNNDNDGTTIDSSSLNDDTIHVNDDKIIHNPLTIELHCRKCASTGPEAGARAFLMGPEPLSIVLCHNRINSDVDEIEEILTHELIHLYDVQTLQLDLTDCETVAYSEVRAAREAECSKYITNHRQRQNQQNQNQQQESNSSNNKNNSNSTNSGIDTILPSIITESWSKAQHSYCVKNIALGAIQNMFPQRGVGKQCLNKVWEKAYKDHRPFNTTNNSRSTNKNTNTQRQQSRQQQQQQQQHNNNNHNGREEKEETSYNDTNTNYYKSSSSGTTTSHAGNVASGK